MEENLKSKEASALTKASTENTQFVDNANEEYDRYGFLVDDSIDCCHGHCFDSSSLISCSWPTTDLIKQRQLIKRGIPLTSRGNIWSTILKAYETKINYKDYFTYKEFIVSFKNKLNYEVTSDYKGTNITGLVTKIDQMIKESAQNKKGETESLQTIRQILLDIDRTYPNHCSFTTDSANQIKLFHILSAYSHFDKTIGYCQGMAYIGGLLLMHIHDEETVFWSFVYLLNSKDHMHMFYDKSLKKIRILCEAMNVLVEKKMPKLATHLKELGVHVLMYGTQWIMCLFTSLNCWESVLMIADIFFAEGVHHLLNTGVALMELCEAELMAMSSLSEALPFLQNIPSRLVHRQKIKSLIFSHPVLTNITKLNLLWSKAKERVEKDESSLEENRQQRKRQKRQRSPELSSDKENPSTLFNKLANVFTPAKRIKSTDDKTAVGMSRPTPATVKSLKKSAKFINTPDCGLIYTSPNTIEMKRITEHRNKEHLIETKRLSFDAIASPNIPSCIGRQSVSINNSNNSPLCLGSPLLRHVMMADGSPVTSVRRSPRIAKRRLNKEPTQHKYLITGDSSSSPLLL